MKATLTRKANGWYNLYQDKIGIGSTHSELQGYKLSKQNCDEIFRVFNVESLAKEEFPNDFDCTLFETLGVTKKSHRSILIGVLQGTLIKGFKKAIELNKDKQFTKDDVISAIVHHTYLLHNDGKGYEDWEYNDDRIDYVIEALKQKPKEIEVEIEMIQGMRVNGIQKPFPVKDSSGCLILKKI